MRNIESYLESLDAMENHGASKLVVECLGDNAGWRAQIVDGVDDVVIYDDNYLIGYGDDMKSAIADLDDLIDT